MTFKLILLLSLACVARGFSFGRSRTLRCYIKSDSSKTFSNMLHTYSVSGGRVSCGRASNRVAGRCQGSFPKLTNDYVRKNICSKVAGIPNNGKGLKVPIYLSGKADCKSNTDTNASSAAYLIWMIPQSLASQSDLSLGSRFRSRYDTKLLELSEIQT